jgi:hypothetical protein
MLFCSGGELLSFEVPLISLDLTSWLANDLTAFLELGDKFYLF